MSGVPFIDGTKIVSFLTRSLVTIETTLRSLDETESREFSRHMETLIDTVRAVGMTDEKWAELVNEARGLIRNQLRNNRMITLNWGLVTLWSTFEALFEDILLTMFQTDNRAFMSWSGKVSLPFDEIVEAASIETIKTKYFRKAITDFSGEGISKRIEILLKKLNIRQEILFSLKNTNDAMKAQLKNWSPETLNDISTNRNRIVHELALPLKTIEELQTIELVLERFLLNLTSIVGQKLDQTMAVYGVPFPPLV